GLIPEEVVDALLALTRALSRAGLGSITVTLDRQPDLEPGPQHRDPVAPGHRNPERVGLDSAVGKQASVHRQGGEFTGYRLGPYPHSAREPAGRRPRPGEHRGTPVQPVPPSGLGANAPAYARVRLQEQDVAAAEQPGAGKSRDPPADDNG